MKMVIYRLQLAGALLYTIFVEPGGKIVYEKQGPIHVAEMKKNIVENGLIGRFYK